MIVSLFSWLRFGMLSLAGLLERLVKQLQLAGKRLMLVLLE